MMHSSHEIKLSGVSGFGPGHRADMIQALFEQERNAQVARDVCANQQNHRSDLAGGFCDWRMVCGVSWYCLDRRAIRRSLLIPLPAPDASSAASKQKRAHIPPPGGGDMRTYARS